MKKNSAFVFLSIILFLITTSSELVKAAPGDLDPTFGISGRITTALGGNSSDRAFAVAVQPDGKIVTVGNRETNAPISDSVIIRYNSDGTLDSTFDFDGIAILSVSTSVEEANSVAIEPDGKILVAGYAYNNSAVGEDFFVLRLKSNGSLDTTFGTGGKVFTDFNGVNDYAFALIVQPDGKILVGGSAGVGNYKDFGLARYNSDGSADNSFGNGGKAIIRGTIFDDQIFDLALQPDGKIVAVGSSFTGTDNHFAALRCNPDGSPDNSFGRNGIVFTNVGTFDWANAVKLQPDGKILAIGSADIGSYDRFAVVRYNNDGSLDNTFDGDGKLTTVISSYGDEAHDAVLQPDGKLLVAGYSLKQIALVRYNSDGSLDPAFNQTGIVTTSIGDIEDRTNAIALQSDGKIIVAGSSFDAVSERDFAVVRYEPNGGLDKTFGYPGRVTTTFRNDSDSATGVALQADGKIVAVGSSRNGTRKDFAVARYQPTGELDRSFGYGGKITTAISSQNDEATAVAIQPDGKILVVGFSTNNNIALVRYNSDGSLDTTFDNDGKVTLSVAIGTVAANDLIIQPDGKIVVAGGAAVVNSNVDFALVRFNPNGSLDTTFGSNGIVTTPITNRTDYVNALALQSDGKLVAAGSVETTASRRTFGLVRYKPDGSLDTSFGSNGIAITLIGDANAEAEAIALQPDGKIVATGFTSANSDFATARYNENGTLDATFNGNGIVTTTVTANSLDEAHDVVIQKNGKIVIVGVTVFTGSEFNIALVRYNTNGLLDSSFNGDGIVVTNYGNLGEAVYAAALQPDGKIVVAGGINLTFVGGVSGIVQRNFAVLRYLGDEVSLRHSLYDFDGDGKSDISVFRPDSGVWYLLNSQSGFTGSQFGISTDKIVPADYDGDGKTDLAVYRSGTWYIQRSSAGFTGVAFGAPDDIPQPADFDGDGKAELAVYRPSNGGWYVYNLATNQFTSAQFGAPTDKPVIGDYNGDGRADYAVYRPLNGTWYIARPGGVPAQNFDSIQFGSADDKPVQADYDGDGKTDVAVFRPSSGTWYRLNSSNGQFTGMQFGISTDLPVAADYDGDGKADIAVFRDGIWYLNRTSAGFTGVQFGKAADQPIPNALIR